MRKITIILDDGSAVTIECQTDWFYAEVCYLFKFLAEWLSVKNIAQTIGG
jgi:hypothetical protein